MCQPDPFGCEFIQKQVGHKGHMLFLVFSKKKKKKEMEKCCSFTKAGNAWGILGACKFLSERQQMN
jgi:hypothetical protein